MLIGEQAYRLSFWRVAAEEINYRRFFDINNLAAIKMELPEVFEATHRFLFELIESGAVTGLRIDHVDGLWNPREYLENLQANTRNHSGRRARTRLVSPRRKDTDVRRETPSGLAGARHHRLSIFTNQVNQLLVDRTAEKSLTETYQRFIGDNPRFADLVYQKKQLTMQLSLASEVHVLAHMLTGSRKRTAGIATLPSTP